VAVSDTAVRQHLKAMGLTCQKPEYQDVARDEGEIARFFDDKFRWCLMLT
jgi:transposase